MVLGQLITLGIGVAISIIGYFLKDLMSEHKQTQKMCIENKAKIDLVENNHLHLSNKFEMVYNAVRELTTEIKTLSKELSKKADN